MSPPGWDGWDAQIDRDYSYNLAKAKELMAGSTYPKGFKLQIEASTGFDKLGQAAAQSWKALGIDTDIVQSPSVSAGQALQVQKKFAVYVTANGLNSSPLLSGLHLSKVAHPFNPWATQDTKVNDWMAQASVLPTPDASKLYKQVWRRVVQLGWEAPICISGTVIAAAKDASGWKVPDGGVAPGPLDLFPP